MGRIVLYGIELEAEVLQKIALFGTRRVPLADPFFGVVPCWPDEYMGGRIAIGAVLEQLGRSGRVLRQRKINPIEFMKRKFAKFHERKVSTASVHLRRTDHRYMMELHPELVARIGALEEKYAAMGQDMRSYLDGLLYADYLTYWDYIHLDTLLSLQSPRTPIADERIFIMYHQITELYFRLTLDAIEQLAQPQEGPDPVLFRRQLERIQRYMSHLIQSFDVMVEGMDRDEFLRFRMSLLPASGFQSVQYRMIEMASTDLGQLVHASKRELTADVTDVRLLYSVLYWKSGASELATGKKTLTLRQFETKYSEALIRYAEQMATCNLRRLWHKLPEEARQDPELRHLMREHDLNVNVRWPLSHYRSAVRYLDAKPKEIEATGGTNWQQYLPPKLQLVTCFPELWSPDELSNWGRFS
jgi:tryptophan 2,3-dioxygenase